MDDQRNIRLNGFKLIDEAQMFSLKSKSKKKKENNSSSSISSDDVRFRPPEVTKAQQVCMVSLKRSDFLGMYREGGCLRLRFASV